MNNNNNNNNNKNRIEMSNNYEELKSNLNIKNTHKLILIILN